MDEARRDVEAGLRVPEETLRDGEETLRAPDEVLREAVPREDVLREAVLREDVLPDEERPREDAPLFELVLPLLLIHLKYSIMDMGFHCQFVNERIKCMAQKIKRRYIRD